MKIQNKRAKEIDNYISNLSEDRQRYQNIEISGTVETLPVYRFDIGLLLYNVNNGRLVIDRKQWEEENKCELNAENHSLEIRKILLELDKPKTQVLKKDIREKGQLDPGVITYDGVVINGNRRMAVIEELHEDESTGKWQFLDAVRLPEKISEKDLWKLEAGLQLSKDKVAAYHAVNELLKIKQGIDAGLSPKEVTAAMYNWDEDEVKDALERLRLIEQFLVLIGQKAHYGVIKKFGLAEYFIDIQKCVLVGAKKEGVKARERARRVEFAFRLLWANVLEKEEKKKGITHWDFRKLGKVFGDFDSYAEFREPFDSKTRHKDVPHSSIIEAFESSVEVLKNKDEREKPLKIINRAIKALQSINLKSECLSEKEVKKKIVELFDIVTMVRDRIVG